MRSETSFEQFERLHVRPRAGRALIVGSKVYPGREDRRRRYTDALGVDMQAGEGVDVVADLDTGRGWEYLGLSGLVDGFDHVECLSVLEHTPRPWVMADNIETLMRPGSTLFVAAPFSWRCHSYPDDYWRFTPDGIRALFPRVEWHAVMLAADRLLDGPKVTVHKDEETGHPFIARCEVVAFGVRK